jgi:glycosyltransferase involved in cell wall biosynthesis
MRIGIDAREMCGHATGVGRYLAGLLTQWSSDERARAHEFVLYAPEGLNLALDARHFATRLVPGPPGTWWEQVRLPATAGRDHLDVFFAPGYTTALRFAVPTVVAIHDVSFTAHPEWFTAREGLRRRWLTRQSAWRARRVLTISEFSRRELVERLGVSNDRISVIPPGLTSPVTPTSVTLGRRPGAGVLYVGSIFNRRRLPDLVRAFAPIARSHAGATLDIIGDDRSHPREDLEGAIAHEGLAGRARWRTFISDADLRTLYRSARAFAFLSEYEGLGLTPLEALSSGVPAVLLDTAVARESCQDAALYVPRGDVAAVTRALEQLLFDEATRERLLAAAPGVLARYDWRRAARDTLTEIERAG